MIHLVDVSTKALLSYHKLYPNERPNVLFSFARLSRDLAKLSSQYRHLIGSLILDSGTFSLNQNPARFSKKVTLPKYSSYLLQLRSRFDFYFNFDRDFSINGFDENLDNQLYLEKLGLNPVPVVHDCNGGEIPYYIKNKDRYPIVAIGSGELAKSNIPELYRIVDKLYSKDIKVHFLGCTRYAKLANLPVFSADSTTWQHCRSGLPLFYWNSEKSGENKQDPVWVRTVPAGKSIKNHIDRHPQRLEIQKYLERELKYTIDDFRKPGAYTKLLVANMHYYVQLEKRIAEEHRKLGFKFWV